MNDLQVVQVTIDHNKATVESLVRVVGDIRVLQNQLQNGVQNQGTIDAVVASINYESRVLSDKIAVLQRINDNHKDSSTGSASTSDEQAAPDADTSSQADSSEGTQQD